MRALLTQPGFRAELRANALLSGPLVLSSLAGAAIHATDAVMVGRLGPGALAATSMAFSLYSLLLWTGVSFVGAASPLMANAMGAGVDVPARLRRVFLATVVCGLIYCALTMPLVWFSDPIFRLLGQEADLSRRASTFARVVMWATPPMILSAILRSFLATIGLARFGLYIAVVGLVVNFIGNYVLIFGHFGAPALGLRGSALASVLTAIIMTLVSAWVAARHPLAAPYRLFASPDPSFTSPNPSFTSPNPPFRAQMREVVALGVPIALTSAFEISVFSAAVILMGWIGETAVAAHAIAIQIASLTFMVPLGIGQATTIRVGMAAGAGDRARIGWAGWSGLLLAMVFMAAAATTIVAFPQLMIGSFIDVSAPANAAVAALATQFLMIAALFQLADGAQVVTAFMLRGIRDARAPMLIAAAGYWPIGLGTGALLAFVAGWGGVGVWLGLALGLFVVAAALVLRWARRDAIITRNWSALTA